MTRTISKHLSSKHLAKQITFTVIFCKNWCDVMVLLRWMCLKLCIRMHYSWSKTSSMYAASWFHRVSHCQHCRWRTYPSFWFHTANNASLAMRQQLFQLVRKPGAFSLSVPSGVSDPSHLHKAHTHTTGKTEDGEIRFLSLCPCSTGLT